MKRILSFILVIAMIFMSFPVCFAFADTTEETIVNVKDFGAIGDGKTDDRQALLDAFDYAIDNLPATVYFPEGDYGLIFNTLYIKLPHGAGNLTVKGDGPDKSRIVYLEDWTTRGEWVAIRIMPELPEGSSDYSGMTLDMYLHDITIKDLGVYDTDPVNHAKYENKELSDKSIEETHGFNIKYCKRAAIINCKIDNVGDEALDMSYCIDSEISGSTVIGSPAAGAAGGAISVGDGCDGVRVYNNVIDGSIATKSNFGIALEALFEPIKNITVENNTVIGINGSGINIGAPAGSIDNLIVSNNVVKDCTMGIVTSSPGDKTNVVLKDNEITGCGYGIYLNSPSTELLIDNCIIDKSTECGLRIMGTNTLIKNTKVTNSSKKAMYFTSSSGKVENCEIDKSGLVDNTVPAVEQYQKASTTIDGLKITNCDNLTAILGVDYINGANVTQTETKDHIAVKRVKRVTNSKFNRSIYVTVEGCEVDNVEITMNSPVSNVAAIYVANAVNTLVQNCNIKVPTGYAIREAGAKSSSNTVKNNVATGGSGFKKLAENSVFENNVLYCIEHSFGDYIYNNDATEEKDGTKTRYCENCPETETIIAEGTQLPKTPKWSFDENTGTLTISGEGRMSDYTAKKAPWSEHYANIKKVVVQDGVTYIGRWAFAYCTNLVEAEISETVTEIGSNAFYNCFDLVKITLPDTISQIAVGTFYKCTALENITIPKSVKTIGKSAFSGCSNLQKVSYTGLEKEWEAVKIADYNAPLVSAEVKFADEVVCWSFDEKTGTLTISGYGKMDDYTAKTAPWSEHYANIKKVVVQDGVTYIGRWAFAYCSKLEEAEVADTVTQIGSNAFYNCFKLSKITIPETVSVINVGTFYKCTALESINIPKAVTIIGKAAFSGCKNLSEINYGGNAADWSKLVIAENNTYFSNAEINYIA